jgi:hypothetical protein
MHWKRGILSTGAPVGEIGAGSFTGTFERQMKRGSGNGASLIKLFWAPFLDPDYVRSLSLGTLWNFCEAPMTWNQNMGYKGPVMRHRFIETESAQTHLLFYSIPRMMRWMS